MKLHEYQSKQFFARYGIPIPKGRVAATASEAKQIAEELGGRTVIKAQVLVGGRGKAGGIRLAKSPEEAEELATHILAMKLKDLPVRKVLVDEAANIDHEIYLGITNDRAARKPVMMSSSAGGIDIEEVAATTPEKIIKQPIDMRWGLRPFEAREILARAGIPHQVIAKGGSILTALAKAFIDSDASLAEINPLALTADGQVQAADAKILIDDNGLFRQKEYASWAETEESNPLEFEAKQEGLTYVKLDGNIGIIGNG